MVPTAGRRRKSRRVSTPVLRTNVGERMSVPRQGREARAKRARRKRRGSAVFFWQRSDDARSMCVDSLLSATLRNGGKQLRGELRRGVECCVRRDNARTRWRGRARSGRRGEAAARATSDRSARRSLARGCRWFARLGPRRRVDATRAGRKCSRPRGCAAKHPPLLWGTMSYRCEATSLEGFIQQLAVAYLPHGYWFCVAGQIPPEKNAAAVDRKLMDRYGIECSRWARARKKRVGGANVHYLRWDRCFVLLATHGQHRFFEDERENVFDVRRSPVRVAGYAVSVRQGHSHVRLDSERYRELKNYFIERSTHRTAAEIAEELRSLPFEPYAPVRQQLFIILRALNRARKAAGFQQVPWTALRLRRRIVRPFDEAREVA